MADSRVSVDSIREIGTRLWSAYKGVSSGRCGFWLAEPNRGVRRLHQHPATPLPVRVATYVARYMVHGESHGIKPPRGSTDQLRTCGYHGSSFVWIHSSLRSTQPLASPAFHLLSSSSAPLPGSARHPRASTNKHLGVRASWIFYLLPDAASSRDFLFAQRPQPHPLHPRSSFSFLVSFRLSSAVETHHRCSLAPFSPIFAFLCPLNALSFPPPPPSSLQGLSATPLLLDPIFLRRLFLLSTHYRCVPLSATLPTSSLLGLFYPCNPSVLSQRFSGSRGGFVLRSKGKFIIRCLFGRATFSPSLYLLSTSCAPLELSMPRAPYRFSFLLRLPLSSFCPCLALDAAFLPPPLFALNRANLSWLERLWNPVFAPFLVRR